MTKSRIPNGARRALDIIKAAHPDDGLSDDGAIAWAVAAQAHCIKNGMIAMTQASFAASLASYAEYCVSKYAGEHIRPVDAGEEVVFEEAGGPMPSRPAGAPVH